jgi:hypothetical protein
LAALCSGQTVSKNRVFSAPVDKKTGVRVFYQHDIKDYFYPPLIIGVIDKDDPRRSTAPLGPEERHVFVIAAEILNLLERLSHANMFWQESDTVEECGPSYKAKGLGYLDITVVYSKGTARSSIGRSEVCNVLESMDPAINTPRALWEFQLYRWFNDCTIPGFDPQKYPDHWE